MNRTLLLVERDDWPQFPSIYVVTHADVEIVPSVKVAVAAYLKTDEGQTFKEQQIGSDHFNWGDVLLDLPEEFLVHEGIYSIDSLEWWACKTIRVNHDENLER